MPTDWLRWRTTAPCCPTRLASRQAPASAVRHGGCRGNSDGTSAADVVREGALGLRVRLQCQRRQMLGLDLLRCFRSQILGSGEHGPNDQHRYLDLLDEVRRRTTHEGATKATTPA